MYSPLAIFPDYECLEEYIKGKHLIKDKNMYLIAGSNHLKHSLLAFYNPKKDSIELELKGKTIDDVVKSGLAFFRMFDKRCSICMEQIL